MSQTEFMHGRADDTFAAVAHSSLSAQAYGQIRKALMVGELKPGQKMNSRDIALQIGTSITPVREALLQLVAEGALESRARQSITVPIPSRAVYLELSELRAEMEGLGAAKAAEQIEPRALAGLAGLQESLTRARAGGDFGKALRFNEAFHLTLCGEARMPRLLKIVENLWAQSGPVLNYLYSGPAGMPVGGEPNYHTRVLDALRARDPDAARRAIRDDILEGGSDMLRRLP